MATKSRTNAENYINKLYDYAKDEEKKKLTEAYKVGNNALNEQQQNMQQQTQDYVNRTDVEAKKLQQAYKPADVSSTFKQQADLQMENQQRKNIATLQAQQQYADDEIERMRKLYADQYSAAIKQAQAENDMERAQMLYDAAKKTQAQLQGFRKNGNLEANRQLIEEIYRSAVESGTQEAKALLAEKLSGLEASMAEQQRATDQNLNQTYVDSLKRGINYNEAQNAYGMGSGNLATAQLARESGMTEDLTALRRLQMANQLGIGLDTAEAQKGYADTIADLVRKNESQKAESLYADALSSRKEKTSNAKSGSGDGKFDQDIYNIQEQLRKFGYDIPLDGIESDAFVKAYNDALKKGWFNMNRDGANANTKINHLQNSVK